eukprot:795897-Prymnesium_polylepis.1
MRRHQPFYHATCATANHAHRADTPRARARAAAPGEELWRILHRGGRLGRMRRLLSRPARGSDFSGRRQCDAIPRDGRRRQGTAAPPADAVDDAHQPHDAPAVRAPPTRADGRDVRARRRGRPDWLALRRRALSVPPPLRLEPKAS